jgi:hypothetical protein
MCWAECNGGIGAVGGVYLGEDVVYCAVDAILSGTEVCVVDVC